MNLIDRSVCRLFGAINSWVILSRRFMISYKPDLKIVGTRMSGGVAESFVNYCVYSSSSRSLRP
jgi:hypothetical protein